VLNAAARLMFRLRRCDHITDAVIVLHWHRLLERVDYKLAVTNRSLHWTDAAVFECDDATHLVAVKRDLLFPVGSLLQLIACGLPVVGHFMFQTLPSFVAHSLYSLFELRLIYW
jgi:hypothetical protein